MLSAILGVLAVMAIGLGVVIVLADSVRLGVVWLAADLVFGCVVRHLWRSHSSLQETFGGHG